MKWSRVQRRIMFFGKTLDHRVLFGAFGIFPLVLRWMAGAYLLSQCLESPAAFLPLKNIQVCSARPSSSGDADARLFDDHRVRVTTKTRSFSTCFETETPSWIPDRYLVVRNGNGPFAWKAELF